MISKQDRLPSWQHVGLARHAGRPTARFYTPRIASSFVELHGDRWGGEDNAIVAGLADIGQITVMLIAQERGGSPAEKELCHSGMAFPEGYRKAMRLMQLAAKFRVPVVTFIDMPGAQATFESERRGIASALATSLALMSNLPTPIVSVIIGEGGSGGAIALAAADRVLMMEHSIYSVISPEGAASILYRDVARAESMSEHLKLKAIDLLGLGIIDKLIPEPKGGAHLDPGGAAAVLRLHITAALQELIHLPERELFAKRYEKFRNLGKGGVYWREEIRSAITGLSAVFFPGANRKPELADH